MRDIIMKKSSLGLAFITLVLAVSSIFGVMGEYSPGISAQTTGISLPNAAIYALNNDNVIFVMPPGATSFTRVGRLGPNPGRAGDILRRTLMPLPDDVAAERDARAHRHRDASHVGAVDGDRCAAPVRGRAAHSSRREARARRSRVHRRRRHPREVEAWRPRRRFG